MSKKTRNSIISALISIALGLTMFFLHEGHMKKARETHSRLAAGISEMGTMMNELVDAANRGGAPEMLSYARNNKPRAAEAANKLRGACDYFEKVRVPGALKDELAAVRAGIPEMRSFADSFEAMFGGVMLESEFVSAAEQMGLRAERLVASDGFAYAEAKFMKELNRLDSQRGFVWLAVNNVQFTMCNV